MIIDKSAAKIALMELRQDIKILALLAFIVAVVVLVGIFPGLLTSVILQTYFDVSAEMAHIIGHIVMGVTILPTTLFLIEYNIARRSHNA